MAGALAGTRFLALAVVSGLVVVVGLTIGFMLLPLTAVNKLVLSTLGAAALALGLEAAGVGANRRAGMALAAAAGVAALWMLQRIVQNMEPAAAWATAIGAFVLTVSTTGSAIYAGKASPLRAAVVGAGLGWGSGVLAFLGASALLAQVGLAVGTASAAVALVQLLRGRESPLGWTLVLPAAVVAALIGTLASAGGELRWYCLIPLPFAPLATLLVPSGARRVSWPWAFAAGMAGLLPLAVAVALAAWPLATSTPAG